MKHACRRLAGIVAAVVLLAAPGVATVVAAAPATDVTAGTAATEGAPGAAGASRRGAILLSLGATLVPVATGAALASEPPDDATEAVGNALVLAGMVLGPSAGHFYAGCGGRGATGIAIRGGTVLLAATILAAVIDDPDTPGETIVEVAEAMSVIAVAGIVMTASAAYDIASAGRCRRPPPAAGGSTGARLELAPLAGPRGSGLALRLTF